MSGDSNIHAGHKKRMRKRFVENGGLKGFSDHEILEILLNYANIRTNTNNTAHRLIKKFGSLKAVFEADITELLAVDGVGETSATLIMLQKELIRIFEARQFESENKDVAYGQSAQIRDNFYKYLISLFSGSRDECMYMFCVDEVGRVKNAELLSDGRGRNVEINQKKLVRVAINNNARGVILAHNHITGIATPSYDDIKNTLVVMETLKALDIDFVDHFIVTDTECVSMSNDGRLKFAQKKY